MSFRVVLAYSGGLDTSVIVHWLREQYGAEVICMAGDVGQPEGMAGLRERALSQGAHAYYGEDLRADFVANYVFPTLRAGAVYARKYLLGTSMARPVLARRQVELARQVGAQAVAHGCTGKGNDQVRFELTYAALAPDLDVIAPWREWSIRSREDALAYARQHGLDLDVEETKLYSRDENLWHISHEGGPLEDPAWEPDDSVFQWTTDPVEAPDRPEWLEISFHQGTPVAVNGEPLDPLALVQKVNEIAARHGVGRADIVEDRLVGMKSRGVYETPGGTVLHMALREIEQLTMDRSSLAMKDELAARYADLVYEGRWWSPEREAMDHAVDALLARTNGAVRLKLFKGAAHVVARTSPSSLYDEGLASFGHGASYDHKDAEGFIRLFGLPTRVLGARERGVEAPAAADANGSAKSAEARAPESRTAEPVGA